MDPLPGDSDQGVTLRPQVCRWPDDRTRARGWLAGVDWVINGLRVLGGDALGLVDRSRLSLRRILEVSKEDRILWDLSDYGKLPNEEEFDRHLRLGADAVILPEYVDRRDLSLALTLARVRSARLIPHVPRNALDCRLVSAFCESNHLWTVRASQRAIYGLSDPLCELCNSEHEKDLEAIDHMVSTGLCVLLTEPVPGYARAVLRTRFGDRVRLTAGQ